MTAETRIRKKKKSSYRSFRISKRIKPPAQKRIPSVVIMIREAFMHMWRDKKLFGGVLLIYILLNLVFVKGFASTIDVTGIRDQLLEGGVAAGTGVNVTLLGVLFGSGSAASSDVGTLYQSIILILASLAFIWLYRQTSADKKPDITVKQPFYDGMTPLVPFLLVICVLGLQLVPMLAGVGLLSTVIGNGLAITFVEQAVWGLLALLLTLLTFYLISSSIFALIIVTLPGSAPISALRSARKIVEYRRAEIMRKLLILTIIFSVVFGLLVFASIAIVPAIAEWFFFVLSAFFLPLTIGVIYKMYRSLL